jgi:unsaturated rhamnogalacturonyl hydrolase
MKVWPVKHSPLLRQPERFIARSELQALIRNVTQNLVNIKDESGQFLLRLDDGRVIDTKGWAGWEWTHGVGLYGIYQYYQQTGDIEMRDIIDRWFADRFAEGATTKNVNTMAPFLTLAYRFEETGRMAYLPWLESWAEWAMHEMPRTEQGGMQHITLAEENHQQMWDDTLMMTVLPLAKIGKLLNRPQYVEEATYQFLLHVQNLMDRETGLWFHGWSYEGRHNFARARWARGNSWLTMVIPDFLELVDLPEGNAVRRYLMTVLNAQIAAWQNARTTAACGIPCWTIRTLILRRRRPPALPTAFSKRCASVTSGSTMPGWLKKRFAALCRIFRRRGAAADLVWHRDGVRPRFYRQIPLTSMPYGQAMAILCLTEYLRKYF